MGLFSKKAGPTVSASTPNEPVTSRRSSSLTAQGDVEHEAAREKNGSHGQPDSNVIDPAVEKRVVRKFDTHVTPLVAFLCKFSFFKHCCSEPDCLVVKADVFPHSNSAGEVKFQPF